MSHEYVATRTDTSDLVDSVLIRLGPLPYPLIIDHSIGNMRMSDRKTVRIHHMTGNTGASHERKVNPAGTLASGYFGGGVNDSLSHFGARNTIDLQLLWEFQNLGFGNRGLVTQRRGEQWQALVELFRIQDLVAAEVAQAHAQVEAAVVRVGRAEAGLKAALASYEGNLKGLSETVRAGQLLQLVNRPQEVVAALQQLQQAYINYYTSANDYNRAQFRLFRALGYASRGLACGDARQGG